MGRRGRPVGRLAHGRQEPGSLPPQRAAAVGADFHQTAFPGRLAAAWPSRRSASTTPRLPSGVISEIARCLVPGRDSDHRGQVSGQLPGTRPARRRTPGWTPPRWPAEPVRRPPTAATSRTLAAASLGVRQVDPRNPPVHLPGTRRRSRVPGHLTQVRPAAALAGNPAALAAALRQRLPDAPLTVTSVVTYLVAGREAASPVSIPAYIKRYANPAARNRA